MQDALGHLRNVTIEIYNRSLIDFEPMTPTSYYLTKGYCLTGPWSVTNGRSAIGGVFISEDGVEGVIAYKSPDPKYMIIYYFQNPTWLLPAHAHVDIISTSVPVDAALVQKMGKVSFQKHKAYRDIAWGTKRGILVASPRDALLRYLLRSLILHIGQIRGARSGWPRLDNQRDYLDKIDHRCGRG